MVKRTPSVDSDHYQKFFCSGGPFSGQSLLLPRDNPSTLVFTARGFAAGQYAAFRSRFSEGSVSAFVYWRPASRS